MREEAQISGGVLVVSPKIHMISWVVLLALGVSVSLLGEEEGQPPWHPSLLSGGGTTYLGEVTDKVFNHSSGGMPHSDQTGDFALGESFFIRDWVFSQEEGKGSDGLGPVFNAPSCVGCHVKSGRGEVGGGEGYGALRAMPAVVQLGYELYSFWLSGGRYPMNQRRGDPVYGLQLQDQAMPGVPVEGRLFLDYSYHRELLKGGQKVVLKKPQTRIQNLGYGPLSVKTQLSLRIPPALIGLGLVEAIAAEDILALEDVFDSDGDGISGRAAWVPVTHYFGVAGGHDLKLGRFGWKADHASLLEQNLQAFFQDMGMNSPIHRPFQGDCQRPQKECFAVEAQDRARKRKVLEKIALENRIDIERITQWEVLPEVEEKTLFYTQSLAPPLRRISDDPHIAKRQKEGEQIFREIGCDSCHRPSFRTSDHHPRPYLRDQEIYPYSDFLLHDMGEDLDDGLVTPHAHSSEWRTPPLWGLGLIQFVNPQAGFLHDGRARTLEEAILWHGGEGTSSKERYRELSSDQRRALLEFLTSL